MKTNRNQDLGKQIANLAALVKREINISTLKTGLPGSKGRIVHFLSARQGEDICQRDIEEEFNMRPASVSELLKGLEDEGYISRTSSLQDARKKFIHLTFKSEAISRQAHKDLSHIEEILKQNISLDDLETFEKVILQMASNMTQTNHE